MLGSQYAVLESDRDERMLQDEEQAHMNSNTKNSEQRIRDDRMQVNTHLSWPLQTHQESRLRQKRVRHGWSSTA